METSFRGGGRIGWVNASWPLATLSAARSRLVLSCMGTYAFAPADVVALEPHGAVPFFASGIRIRHLRPDYPGKIIFWCMGGRDRVLTAIREAGFIPSGDAGSEPARGFPLRWGVVIGVGLLWNLLFLLDGAVLASGRREPGGFALLALVSLFALASATRVSPAVQRRVLRDGHHLGEIRAALTLLQVVSGFLSVVFSVILVSRLAG